MRPPLCSRPPFQDKGGLPAAMHCSMSATVICLIDWNQSIEQYRYSWWYKTTLRCAFAIWLIDWHKSIKLSSLRIYLYVTVCYSTLPAWLIGTNQSSNSVVTVCFCFVRRVGGWDNFSTCSHSCARQQTENFPSFVKPVLAVQCNNSWGSL